MLLLDRVYIYVVFSRLKFVILTVGPLYNFYLYMNR